MNDHGVLRRTVAAVAALLVVLLLVASALAFVAAGLPLSLP